MIDLPLRRAVRHLRHCAIAVLLGMLLPGWASATTLLAIGFGDAVERAETVVEAEVRSVRTEWPKGQPHPHTWVELSTLAVLAGSAPETIRLRFVGGKAGDRRVDVAESPIPVQGERGVFFIESLDRPMLNPLFGWKQGLLRLRKDATGEWRVFTADGDAVIGLDVRAKAAPGHFSSGVAAGLTTAAPGKALPVSAAALKSAVLEASKARPDAVR